MHVNGDIGTSVSNTLVGAQPIAISITPSASSSSAPSQQRHGDMHMGVGISRSVSLSRRNAMVDIDLDTRGVPWSSVTEAQSGIKVVYESSTERL